MGDGGCWVHGEIRSVEREGMLSMDKERQVVGTR